LSRDGLTRFSPATGSASVLNRPWGGLAQNVCSVKGPVGIAEHLAGQQDQVGLAGADYLVCLRGFGDHTDGTSRNGGFVMNGFGVVDLIAGAEGNLLGWVVATGGDVDEIDACLLYEFGEGDGLWQVP